MNKIVANKMAGLKRLIEQGREKFRVPENTLYYSAEYFKLAEKKYIKYCVLGGRC